MAFKFRLQKVLNYRQQRVDQQSRQVGEAARKLAEIQRERESILSEIQSLISTPDSIENADLQGWQARRSWLDHLQTREKEVQEKEVQACQEWEKQREELTRVWRDLEVLKKLKTRQKETWQEEIFRRENLELDEIGQIRADRQQRENLSAHQEHHATVDENQPLKRA